MLRASDNRRNHPHDEPRGAPHFIDRGDDAGRDDIVAFSLAVVDRHAHMQMPPTLCQEKKKNDDHHLPRQKRHREFALVHEKENRGWWLPGGGVDAGQTLEEAAIREVYEEAGCDVTLTGVLRIEVSRFGGGRLRVIYHARAVRPDEPLKSKADAESRGAVWATADDVQCLDGRLPVVGMEQHPWLRGPEPLHWFRYLDGGGTAAPMGFLQSVRLPAVGGEGGYDEGGGRCVCSTQRWARVAVADSAQIGSRTRFLLVSDDDAGGDGTLRFPGCRVYGHDPDFYRTARQVVGDRFRVVGLLGVEHYILNDAKAGESGGRSGSRQTALLRICFLAVPVDNECIEGRDVAPNEGLANGSQWVTLGELRTISAEPELDRGFPPFDMARAAHVAVSGMVEPLYRLAGDENEAPPLAGSSEEEDGADTPQPVGLSDADSAWLSLLRGSEETSAMK